MAASLESLQITGEKQQEFSPIAGGSARRHSHGGGVWQNFLGNSTYSLQNIQSHHTTQQSSFWVISPKKLKAQCPPKMLICSSFIANTGMSFSEWTGRLWTTQTAYHSVLRITEHGARRHGGALNTRVSVKRACLNTCSLSESS